MKLWCIKQLISGRVPVCKCQLEREECADCKEGFMERIKAGLPCHFKVSYDEPKETSAKSEGKFAFFATKPNSILSNNNCPMWSWSNTTIVIAYVWCLFNWCFFYLVAGVAVHHQQCQVRRKLCQKQSLRMWRPPLQPPMLSMQAVGLVVLSNSE